MLDSRVSTDIQAHMQICSWKVESKPGVGAKQSDQRITPTTGTSQAMTAQSMAVKGIPEARPRSS